MSRIFLIDGYNLMHKISSIKQKMGSDLEGSRYDFIQQLSNFAAGKNISITVVFDGRGGYSPVESRPGGVKIIFSKGPEKADPLIKRIIDQEGGGPQLNVVSSDREILNYAKLCSCSLITSPEFILLMSSRPEITDEKKPDVKMSKNDMADWLDLFQSKSVPPE